MAMSRPDVTFHTQSVLSYEPVTTYCSSSSRKAPPVTCFSWPISVMRG